MQLLSFIGLCTGFVGAVFLAAGLPVSLPTAIEIAKPIYADQVDANTAAVKDRMRQARLAKVGLVLLVFGFALQAGAAWPFSVADAGTVVLPAWAPEAVVAAGLALGFFAAFWVLPGIFISEAEIRELSELPLAASSTRFTTTESRENMPAALTDVDALRTYRERFLEARQAERRRGYVGLRLLVIGFGLQLVGVLMGLAPA